MPLQSVNPATGEVLETYEEQSAKQVREVLDLAVDVYPKWRRRTVEDRGDVLYRVANTLSRDVEAHAMQITREMGKPLREARAEVQKSVRALKWCADNAEEPLGMRKVDDWTRVVPEPLGPVLGVMPWNYPYWQVVRFAAPALMAGNVVLVKHASNVTGCLLSLQAAFQESGAGYTFQALLIPGKRVGTVLRNKRVRAVSVTGSEETGKTVARTAGAYLKPSVMELGGSDPFIVFADADVEEAARMAVKARCVNSGQSCIAAKRFFVEEDAADEFLAAFTDAMRDQHVGDPTSTKTQIGPLAREDLRDAVHAQVQKTVDEGAKMRLGGEPLERDGYYYAPTLLTDVPDDATALTEEVFGPVAPVVTFSSEEEAVFRANATRYGLGASVWTADEEKSARLAPQLECGLVFVNDTVKSDPKAPFGGTKASGYGRELGPEGFLAFTNLKTLVKRSA